MGDPEKFQRYLGEGEYYQDFLVFFQRRIGEVGWERVVQETFFGVEESEGGERGDDMLVRLFASEFYCFSLSGIDVGGLVLDERNAYMLYLGLIHPIIHLGFGIEYNQYLLFLFREMVRDQKVYSEFKSQSLSTLFQHALLAPRITPS